MNELVDNPFQTNTNVANVSAGTRGLQARENTEVMALAMMAKRFPRDPIACCDRIKNAFTRVALAEKAEYAFSRGGSDISGPSIHAAQAIAQQWGNMNNGWKEIARFVGPDGVGVSEVEAFCVDYETTNRESIQFVVRHWRDTRSGGYKLKEERDIYELCANQAQRRKRACILAQLPGDVVEMAMKQAAITLKSTADTSPEAMAKMLEAFSGFGVTKEHIEKRIQRRIDAIQPAQVVMLKRIYVSLRDDVSVPADWFATDDSASTPGAPPAGGSTTVGDIKGKAAAKKAVATPPPAADTKAGADATNGATAATDKPASETTADAKKVDEGKPIVTFAEVQHAINAATTVEQLDDAASVISAVGNREQMKELNQAYSDKRTKLGAD